MADSLTTATGTRRLAATVFDTSSVCTGLGHRGKVAEVVESAARAGDGRAERER